MQEPVLTWNLFWTTIVVPISVFLLGWYINRLEKTKETRENIQKRLEEENQRLIADELKSWRERFATTLCTVKKTVENIDLRLDGKQETANCIKMNDDVWEAINSVRKQHHEDILTLNRGRE